MGHEAGCINPISFMYDAAHDHHVTMAGDEKDGYYCSICGGIPPDKIKTRRVLIDGKETGIDHLDFILDNVRQLHLSDDDEITAAIMVRVKEFNYVPTKVEARYAEALLREYKQQATGDA
jgi:predicted transcriptional regulator